LAGQSRFLSQRNLAGAGGRYDGVASTGCRCRVEGRAVDLAVVWSTSAPGDLDVGTVFDPFLLASTTAQVLSQGHASETSVARWQQERLGQLLATARRGSPLYRERLAKLPDDASALVRVAPVSRDELMGRFSEWVTDPDLVLSELQAFTADPLRLGEPYLGRYLVWESSGTSGLPGIFVQDARAMAVYDALETVRRCPDQRSRRWLDPFYLSERMAFVGATGGHFASFVSLERLRQLQPWLAPSMRSFSILQPVDALVNALNAFAPTVLASYPTAALLLAEEAERGRLNVGLREVWTGGETLSPAVRQRIETALSCRVRNSYGASEFLAMGWECEVGHLHLNNDWLVLEPVDEHNRPVPPGQPSCGVLLTNLANNVQPLIRYAMGDQLTLHVERCECGSPFPVIEVQGRRDDTVHMQGPRGEVALLPLALSTVLEEQAGVFDFQIRQRDASTLVLRLPMAGQAGREALKTCRAALQSFALAQGTLPIRVLGELGQAVPRGRSGKACRILAKGSGS